ncbi:MAG: methylenetetrahydrofolate reductase [NAD(P)H] [Lachnospiraceae bacterium]|nr:methylenetetrahydrofolate reductase [NAD(P)H] [Lachnospiraceae bacterium]
MIQDIFQQKKTTLSFEVFPPKKADEFEAVYQTLDQLSQLGPDFISVTYGAGGSRSKKTIEISSYIQNTLHIESLSHMTCVGNTRQDIREICAQLDAAGLRNVLALRGDRPQYMTDEQFNAREFTYATDLVKFLKEETPIQIAGACYPEKHFEAASPESDLAHLKEKVSAGCSFLITQLFFDNRFFYQFRERCQKAGIEIPICAGIMPITSAKQLGTTVTLSGSSVPKTLSDLIAKYGDAPDDMRKAGIDYAICQINDLIANDVSGIHIYTMNKPRTAKEIVSSIER